MKKAVAASVICTLACVAIVLSAAHYLMQGAWKPRPEGAPTAAPTGEGWINLLSEEEIPLWKNITDDMDIFEIKDGELHIFGRTLTKLRYAGYTGRAFSDFELHLEFKVTRRANSGLFLRVLENDPVRRGFEVQVIDDHGKPPTLTGSGAIYDAVSPMFNLARPAGEWNSYDISARNGHIVVHMNGWKVIDVNFDQMTKPVGKFTLPFAELPREGLIALQDHGGEVWYRNVFVRPFDAAEAPANNDQVAPAGE